MSRFLRALRGLLLENVGWKLLALGLAVVLWIVVASEPELSTFASARVAYKNLPDNLEVSSDPVTEVTLELRGPSGELRGLGEEGIRPAVVLDMTGVQPGERSYAVGSGNVRLPRGLRVIRSIPSEVRYRFELRATRLVRVVPRFSGEGQNGYAVANWAVDPGQLEIQGPTSRVERIREVVTDPVNVSNVVGLKEFHVNAYIADPFVRFATSPQVTVSVAMRKQ